MSEVATHRWTAKALTGDLTKGVLSLGVALFLLAAAPFGSIGSVIALCLAIVFGLYLAHTVSRLRTVVEVDDQGLLLSGGLFGPKTIKWSELERFELRYFSLRRDRKEGWMDLKLKARGQTVAIDDRLDGFHDVLARAWTGARSADIGVSDATHANLVAAGIIAKPRSHG